jgi:ureidoglycolate lyase
MKIEKLTKPAFAQFGDVIETDGVEPLEINQGFAQRFNDLARIDVGDGQTNVSLFTAVQRPIPIAIKLMERHPLGSQLFYPLQIQDWYVLVCTDPNDRNSFRAFRASGKQGVNYKPNAWHHPLLVASESRFIVIDRKGAGNNLEEVWLEKDFLLEL